MNRIVSAVRQWGSQLARGRFHPLWGLGAVVAITQIFDDSCYPFSDFPMYGQFGGQSQYVYVDGADGQVVALNDVTGMSASQVNKSFRRHLADAGFGSLTIEAERTKARELAAAKLLKQLRDQAAKRQKKKSRKKSQEASALVSLPEKLRFHEVVITLDEARLVEKHQLVFQEP